MKRLKEGPGCQGSSAKSTSLAPRVKAKSNPIVGGRLYTHVLDALNSRELTPADTGFRTPLVPRPGYVGYVGLPSSRSISSG